MFIKRMRRGGPDFAYDGSGAAGASFRRIAAPAFICLGVNMTKLEMPPSHLEISASPGLSTVGQESETHPQDLVVSGLFGNGRVVALLKNAEGYAYGHRIQFENGMEAELLITGVATRH